MFKDFNDLDFNDLGNVSSVAKDFIRSINNTLDNKVTNLSYDMLIFIEVLKKTQYDLKQISLDMDNNIPDIYKQYGILAYWIKRLKPFDEKSTIYKNYTNETIIFSFIIAKISHKKSKIHIPKNFFNTLLYLIRFEQISKHGIIAILSGMFEIK